MSKNLNDFFNESSQIKQVFLEIYSNILNSRPDTASEFFRKNWSIWESYAEGRTINKQ